MTFALLGDESDDAAVVTPAFKPGQQKGSAVTKPKPSNDSDSDSESDDSSEPGNESFSFLM